MALVTASRETALPTAQVWELLDDFGGIYRFSAGVESSPIKAGSPERGVGAVRICQLYDGNHIEERVTGSIEGEKLSIVIVDTSMPIKSATAAFTLAPTDSGGTVVTMEMDYVVKFGPLGVLMDAMMMKRMMNGTLHRILAALDYHGTTGELVGKDWKEDTAANSGAPSKSAGQVA